MARTLAIAILLVLLCAGPAAAETVWAVGDGAVAGGEDDALAAHVASEGIDHLLYLGDVYETGTAADYRDNYAPSWGRFKQMTSPTPGNHEWGNRAVGYDPYWGSLAPRTDGGHWYSFDLGGWHLISLNSENNTEAGSRQLNWLRGDLARHPGTCTIAFWHRPLLSAGGHSDATETRPFWDELEGHATLVLNGHDHDYQRFLRTRGITEIVVGSGGRRPLDPVNRGDSRLAFANDTSLGALRMELSSGRVDYEQVAPDGTRLDNGSLTCATASDATAPALSVGRPRAGRVYSRRFGAIRGSSKNLAGGIRLTLMRTLGGGRCQVLAGRRLRPASCASRRALTVVAAPRWSFRLPSGLPRGRYALTARGRSADGRLASKRVVFRLR